MLQTFPLHRPNLGAVTRGTGEIQQVGGSQFSQQQLVQQSCDWILHKAAMHGSHHDRGSIG